MRRCIDVSMYQIPKLEDHAAAQEKVRSMVVILGNSWYFGRIKKSGMFNSIYVY